MTNCNETIKDLYQFLDGELPVEVRDHVQDHLGGCGNCLEAFDFEAELKAAIRRKCSTEELPDGLLSRLESCLQTDLGVVDDRLP